MEIGGCFGQQAAQAVEGFVTGFLFRRLRLNGDTRHFAEFIQSFDPKRERCWIAERDGEIVGSVMLVKKTDEVAKLRLLLVEPKARGLGIGARLVNECVRFARQVGYRKITLWTNSVLTAARHIYERAGFRLVASEKRKSWSKDVVSEQWEMAL